jgi:hypothetical protein
MVTLKSSQNTYVGIASNVSGSDDILEVVSDAGPGGNYRAIKASQFQTASSIAYKENVKDFDGSALDIIKQLSVVLFNYKNSDESQIGLIAEDTPYPLADDEHKSINMSNLVGILLKGLQELAEKL